MHWQEKRAYVTSPAPYLINAVGMAYIPCALQCTLFFPAGPHIAVASGKGDKLSPMATKRTIVPRANIMIIIYK